MDELTDAERLLRDSAGTEDDHVVLGTPSPEEVSDGATWGVERQVRAEVVHQLLTGEGSGRRSLALVGARIVGTLDLSSVTVRVPLLLRRCFFDGDVVLADATTRRIDLDGSYVTGQLTATGLQASDSFLVTNAWCRGGVWMIGADIKGSVSFSGTTIGSPAGDAVVADHLGARDLLVNNSRILGTVRLTSARLSGAVSMNGTEIHGSDGTALLADDVTVAGTFHAQGSRQSGRDFTATGAVNLLGSRIGGSVNLAGARLEVADPTHAALLADRLEANGGLRLRNGFTATGTVSLSGATVRGQVDCGAAELRGTPAFVADSATVTGDVLMNRGLVAVGDVRFMQAEVGKQLSFTTAQPDGTACAVLLGGLRADALLTTWASAPARLDLGGAEVDTFLDSPATWPEPGSVVLSGFTYRQLAQPGTASARLGWAARNLSGYAPEVYDVLAGAYRSAGDEESARAVLIGKQRARRERPGRRHAPARWWSSFLRWTVGYGYAPTRIVPWFVGMLLLGSLVFAGPARDSLVPTSEAARAQDLQPFLYSLDLLLPVASLGVRSGWTPLGAVQWLVIGFTLVGWLLGLTLLAAISGALKRD